jgi:VWFA-related protein
LIYRRDLLLSLAQWPTYRVQAPLVVVPVTVTGRDGQLVDGLQASDFRLFDNGEPRRFDFDTERQPLSLVVAVQTSRVSKAALERIRNAGSLIEPLILGVNGEAALIAYNAEARIIEEFTRSGARIRLAMKGLTPRGQGNALHDALALGVRMLGDRDRVRRRAILFFGEAKDQSSKTSLPDLLNEVQRANVSVYPVTYSAFLSGWMEKAEQAPPPGTGMTVDILAIIKATAALGKTSSAAMLATYSGGRSSGFLKQATLEQALTRLGEELHSEYSLSFEPVGVQTGQYRPLRVDLPTTPGAIARYRPGYWLPGLG